MSLIKYLKFKFLFLPSSQKLNLHFYNLKLCIKDGLNSK